MTYNVADHDGIIIEEILIPLKVGSLVVDATTRHVSCVLDLVQGNDQAVAAIKKGPVVKVSLASRLKLHGRASRSSWAKSPIFYMADRL